MISDITSTELLPNVNIGDRFHVQHESLASKVEPNECFRVADVEHHYVATFAQEGDEKPSVSGYVYLLVVTLEKRQK